MEKMHGIKGFRGITLRVFECPNCGKRRMYRPMDHEISSLKMPSMDNSKIRLVDVCDACLIKYMKEDEYYKEVKKNKAKKALEKGEDMPDGVSIEDAL